MNPVLPDSSIQFHNKLKLHAVLALAVFIIGLSMVFVVAAKQSQGPYWLGHNNDPDYCYLLNACAIAQFHAPGHFDHPGTPLQVLGAIIVSTGHIFANTIVPLDQDIIEQPEHYLNSISAVLNLGLLIGLLWLGIYSYLSTGSLALALFPLTLIFTSSAVLVSAVQVSPEPALLIIVLLLQITLVSTFTKDRNQQITGVIFPLLAGLGIATKVTFMPVAIIPLLVIKGLKNKLTFCAGTIGFFILFTLPAAVHYRAMAKWFLNLATHTGTYGYGSPGIINPAEYVKTLKSLFSAEPILFISLALSFVYLLVIFLHNKNRHHNADNLFRTLAACLTSQLLSILMVAKHPDQRYLVPALAFIGFNAGIMALHSSNYFKTRRNTIAGFFVVYFIVLVSPVFQYPTTLKNLKTIQIDGRYVASIAQENSSAAKVFYYGASSIPYALYFGNSYAGKLFSTRLQATYPKVLFYDPWGATFHDYLHRLTSDSLASLARHSLLFQGCSFETRGIGLGLQKPTFAINKIIERSNEAVYQTVPVD